MFNDNSCRHNLPFRFIVGEKKLRLLLEVEHSAKYYIHMYDITQIPFLLSNTIDVNWACRYFSIRSEAKAIPLPS